METTNNSSLQRLISHLQVLVASKEGPQREDAIFRINELLAHPNASEVVGQDELKPYLEEGLKHLDSDIGNITLNALLLLADNAGFVERLGQVQYQNALIHAIHGKNLTVVDKVVRIFKKMAAAPVGLPIIFDANAIANFKQIEKKSDEIRFRVLDLFAEISSVSPAAFSECERSGFLSAILATVDSDDILQQMNGLELFDKIVRSPEGITFMENSKMIGKLCGILKSDDLANAMLGPKIISFFGELGVKSDLEIALFERNSLLATLKSVLEEGSPEAKAAAITAIGKIGSNWKGMDYLASHSSSNTFQEYLWNVNVEGDLRVLFLHSLAHLLISLGKNREGGKANEYLRDALTSVTARNGKTSNITEIVMPLLRHPFVDQRHAVLDLLSGLACHSWGVTQLMNYPGFFEHVTNRASEETKEGKEWQFAIVQNLVRTCDSSSSSGNQIVDKSKLQDLHGYLRKGVFYVQGESTLEVATKDGAGGV